MNSANSSRVLKSLYDTSSVSSGPSLFFCTCITLSILCTRITLKEQVAHRGMDHQSEKCSGDTHLFLLELGPRDNFLESSNDDRPVEIRAWVQANTFLLEYLEDH